MKYILCIGISISISISINSCILAIMVEMIHTELKEEK